MVVMAFSKMFIIIAMVAVFVPSIFATDYVVGDETGWTIKFDYQAWAQGKEFKVGDKLVFKYPQGEHTVLKVDGAAFQQCMAPAGIEALTSGNDVITLASPGKKWYMCGVGQHCAVGNQKLAITVLPQLEAPASAPSPTAVSAATGNAAFRYYAWILAMFAILGMVIV